MQPSWHRFIFIDCFSEMKVISQKNMRQIPFLFIETFFAFHLTFLFPHETLFLLNCIKIGLAFNTNSYYNGSWYEFVLIRREHHAGLSGVS